VIRVGPALFQRDETRTHYRMSTRDGRFEVLVQKVGGEIDETDADEVQAVQVVMQSLLMSKVIAWVYRQGRNGNAKRRKD
jgi:hypothetical protein